ncbi:hypothetical protein F5Y17DRAFT_456349 [Xylariaceae sp. FL0594]|nr:hypothetical protein F5Y17DRAFT_456349 [Xylariaceae sp. FL0594]
MQPNASTTKAQPWKAGWLARNAPGAQKAPPKGTSHGAPQGDALVIGGFTSGVSIKMTPDKAQIQDKGRRNVNMDTFDTRIQTEDLILAF